LGNALVLASGKSLSTIRRWLAEQSQSASKQDTSDALLLKRLKREVENAHERLSECEGSYGPLLEALERVMACLKDDTTTSES